MAEIPGGPPGDWVEWRTLPSVTGAVVGFGLNADGFLYYSVRDEAGSSWRPVVKITA